MSQVSSYHNLFDEKAGQALKDQGQARAEQGRAALLEEARSIAIWFATNGGETDIDEVQAELLRRGYAPADLANAAGSVFKGKLWQFVRYAKSRRTSNRRRVIAVWRLKSAGG